MQKCVVVADDNRNIRTVIKMSLESLGYKVLEAANGLEALEIIGNSRPDIVVLDVMMPKIDGYEVCFRLKKSPELRDIPVVMLTAKTNKEDKFLGREVGADRYLSKPFDPEELEDVIQRILESKEKGESIHPLTGLPTWPAVKHEIARRKELGLEFNVIEGFFDQQAFDIYQKKYGNIKADEALKAVSQIFRSTAEGIDDFFIGHSGDNIFFFISSPITVYKVKDAVNRKLEEAIPLLYDDSDRNMQGILIRKADGGREKVGLMKWIWKVSE